MRFTTLLILTFFLPALVAPHYTVHAQEFYDGSFTFVRDDTLAIPGTKIYAFLRRPIILSSFVVTASAYTSAVDETDGNPFITASGTRVHHGTVAANFLPFGTMVTLPGYFGERVFTVEDRTHPRFADRVDIWMETKNEAFAFGLRRLILHVVTIPTVD